jgi:glycosyltransferase involved in cell wall biosynthesis
MADPRLSNAHLVIVGDGPQCDALVTRVRDSGIADRVTFAGRQGDVVPWLHSFNVFVLPSTGNEGVPQAVMQAMAAGLPIVSTPVGAIGEVVDDGRTGILVPPGESAPLAEAIAALLGNAQMATSLGQDGLREAQARFSEAIMLDRMEEVLADAIAGRRFS